MLNFRTIQSINPIIEVPATSGIDWTNPTIAKLVEQGGTIATLVLVCLFVALLTQLIKAANRD